jgi:hypothetical protein
MSDDDSEIAKVLAKAGELRKAVGQSWTALILLFSVWTLRERPGLWTTIASAVAVVVTVWLRLS